MDNPESCPILLFIAAKGDCGFTPEERQTSSDLIVQDHNFIILVEQEQMSEVELKEIIHNAQTKKYTLSRVYEQFPKAYVCDSWQGKASMAELQSIKATSTDGHSFWHQDSWQQAYVSGVFHFPKNPSQAFSGCMQELLNEESQLSLHIKQTIIKYVEEQEPSKQAAFERLMGSGMTPGSH